MDFSLSIWDYLLFGTAVSIFLFWYITRPQRRFSKSKVPHLKPAPIFGNTWRNLLQLENQIYSYGRAYTNFPEARFCGLYELLKPLVMIRDPELIRQIGVKDFDHFVDHSFFIDETTEPILGNMMIVMKGQKWRDMRATLSPAFTGSKMRNMYSLVSECAQQMAEYLKKETKEKGPMVAEMKQLFSKYGNDVIATAAFGIRINTLEQPDNDFFKAVQGITNISGIAAILKFIGFNFTPKLMKALGISFLDKSVMNFFRQLVHGTMSTRQKEGIIRPDMIHLLMQAKQGTLQHDSTNATLAQQQDAGFATVTESDVGKAKVKKRVWKDDELTAQAVIFLIAGFDTSTSLLSFTAYELALNPEIQKQLQQEIDEVLLDLDGEMPGYERINRMKYLDMVLAEGLRLWPPVAFLDRTCTKPYVLEENGGIKHTIQKGEGILFPVYHIHRDPKYYPNPDKFDPERFSDENKKDIKPFTYLPFGVGPRNCIGSRFALMETKSLLFHILSHFNFNTCYKTENPIQLSRKDFDLVTANGIWLEIAPRNLEDGR